MTIAVMIAALNAAATIPASRSNLLISNSLLVCIYALPLRYPTIAVFAASQPRHTVVL